MYYMHAFMSADILHIMVFIFMLSYSHTNPPLLSLFEGEVVAGGGGGHFHWKLYYVREKGVKGGGGRGAIGRPLPIMPFRNFCLYIWASMSFVPTKYLMYRQNIERNSSLRM